MLQVDLSQIFWGLQMQELSHLILFHLFSLWFWFFIVDLSHFKQIYLFHFEYIIHLACKY